MILYYYLISNDTLLLFNLNDTLLLFDLNDTLLLFNINDTLLLFNINDTLLLFNINDTLISNNTLVAVEKFFQRIKFFKISNNSLLLFDTKRYFNII